MKPVPFIALLLFSAIASAEELPNPSLTPGAVDPEVTQENLKESICRSTHFSWTEGHMPPLSYMQGIEKDQLKLYGYADSNIRHYEVDHLIPLSLGGHPTDLNNIWPQPLMAKWSARRKDYLEEVLHGKVCKGQIQLKDAQDQIRSNWIETYRKYLGDPDKH